MAQVKFYRGVVAGYNATTHADGIYFSTDTQEIYLDGKAYGSSKADIDALQKAVLKAELTKGSEDAAGVITLTHKDNTTTTITLPSVAAGNGLAVAVAEGVYTVSVNLDTTNNKFLTNTASGLAAKATLNYDSGSKKIQLMAADGETVASEISADDFVKDGMLDSVEFVETDGKKTGLKFTWNTDSGKTQTDTVIPLDEIFEAYNFGNGLSIDKTTNTVSVKVKEGETYVAVDGDGVHTTEALSGKFTEIDSSISGIKETIEDNEKVTAAALVDLDASVAAIKEVLTWNEVVVTPGD